MKMTRDKTNFANKLQLCTFGTLSHAIEIKDPIHKLLSDYSEIVNVLNIINNSIELTKFLYFNKTQVHKILYDSEQMIELNHPNRNIELGHYFYLCLLINDNNNIINYNYSLDYIITLNNYDNNNFLLKKIILSKIIIDLINNYEGGNTYNEKNDGILKQVELDNYNILENNNNILKEYKIDLKEEDILSINIEDLYIQIIISILKLDKFDDIDYINNIVNQLDLDNINITKNMYEILTNILNSNDSLINKYSITKIEDLYNMNIINFHFFLYRYIIKDSFYIYNISFLFKTKKIIINILKNKLDQLLPLKVNDKDIKKRIEYLLQVISDSKYYFIKYLKFSKIKPLEQILYYYKEYRYETKKNEIKIIEKVLNNNNENNNENIYEINLKDLEDAKKMEERKPIIEYLFKLNLKKRDKNLGISEGEYNKYISQWMNIEKMINEKKIKEINGDVKIDLIKYFNNTKNTELLLKIFNKDSYNYFINENIKFLKENNDNIINENENENENENNIINNEIKSEKSQNFNSNSQVPKSTNISGKLFQIKLIFKNYR